MFGQKRWSRRDVLRIGLAGTAFGALPVGLLSAAEPKKASASSERTLFLFVDWFHVKKGDLQVTLDPARISPAGRTLLDTYARDFNKKFDQEGHGFRPVDVPFGIRIVQEVAERSQPWLLADKPWEKNATSPTVLCEEGKYRCWYQARLVGEPLKTTVDQERVMEVSGSALAYAESTDGWNWTKPALDILSFRGSRTNNLVSPWNNGGAIFRDDHGPVEERYKGFQFDALPKDDIAANAGSMAKYGLYAVISPDGYHWTKGTRPLIRYFSDTVNIAGWDPLLEKYVGYFRHHLSGRTISRAETSDFHEWPAPQPLLYAGPLDAPTDDYYTNCYTTYPGDPSLRLLFPAIYHRDSDSVDVRLAVSRDGRAYSWVSYEPIVKLGAAGQWDGGSLYAQPNLVQLPDGRLALPYDAYNTTHNEIFFENFYTDYKATSGIAWALWQDARLAGIEASQLGQFTMNAAIFKGKQIEINARTARAGSVEVELREKGKPVEGFSFADAVPVSGDAPWTRLRWKGADDLSAFRGKYLELAIRLRSAKIFACRFV
ncbi:MAG TPA: hypothetical protein VL475_09285 [Planctomycetaceae bacterium]|jgi:hypothetical protein|nr:hypothetical protein [Planctomycetaceae bacterium]